MDIVNNNDLLLFVDTETTGIVDFKKPADDPSQPRMAAFAAVLAYADDLSVAGIYHAYIQPDGWSMSQGDGSAGAVNNISDEHLRKVGVPIESALGGLCDWLSLGVVLVAHNVQFDYKILRGELRRAKFEDYYQRTTTFCTMWENVGVCKLPNAGGKSKYKLPKLDEAYRHWFKEEPQGKHSAFNDALNCKRIYGAMRRSGLEMIPKKPKAEDDSTSAPRPSEIKAASSAPAVASEDESLL